MLCGALIAGLDQVPRNINAQHFRSQFRCWQRRGAVAASEIQNLKAFSDSESLHERLSAFAHGLSNAREVAFFPKCSVWIYRSIHHEFVLWLRFALSCCVHCLVWLFLIPTGWYVLG